MKFRIEAKLFAAAVASVSRMVETRTTIPILANIVLSADGDTLSIRGTDLDIETTVTVAAEVTGPGSTTVPARLISDIAKKAAGDVSFELEAGSSQAVVSSGRSRFKLMTLPAEDMPSLTMGEFIHSFTMSGADLHSALSAVQFAQSTEETRYYLNGVFLHRLDEPVLRFVATDGHRLARMEIDAPEGTDGMPGIIIPRKAVKEAIVLADAAKTDPVIVDVSSSKIRFSAASTVLTSKLIDGQFPEYQRVIPQGGNIIAIVGSKLLAAGVDRVSTINSERGRAVKLRFSANSLSLTATSADAGSAEDIIDVDFDADDFEIGFNGAYMGDLLRALGTGDIKITFTDSGSPTVFTSDTTPELLGVLMPMRT